MKGSREIGKIGHSWGRRQWLRLVAWVEDHPVSTLLAVGIGCGFLVFYGVRLGGISHFSTSFARWRVENFGGVLELDRSIRVFDALLSFEPVGYDRLDVVGLGAMPIGLTAMREEFGNVVGREGGRVRYLALDPRLGMEGSAGSEAFGRLARHYGMEAWELREGARLTMNAAGHLAAKLGPESFEVRLVSDFGEGTEVREWLAGSRGAMASRSDDPGQRVDVLMPSEEALDGGALAAPVLLIRNRPDHPRVRAVREAFEELWKRAVPLDEALRRGVKEDAMLNG